MIYKILANLILIIHLLYVIFAIGGELVIIIGAIFKWKFIRYLSFRISHLTCILIVAIEAIAGVICPLTIWENRLRTLSGQYIDEDLTFIARLVRKVMYYDFPSWVFTLSYILFAVLIIVTMILIPPSSKK